MATEMVRSATSENLIDMDWTTNIKICELVAKDHGKARDVVKCVKKRLGHKNVNIQFFTVREAMRRNFAQVYAKREVRRDIDPDLEASRVQFPQRNHFQSTQESQAKEITKHSKDFPAGVSESNERQGAAKEPSSELDNSIICKATGAMEVLRETLNALAPRHPEGAADEFILDLVEQCSFEKERVTHLVMTCHDEKLIAQAIELNEQLDRVLTQHDSLLSLRAPSTTGLFVNEAEEDEECLLRRMCKGKALAEDNLKFSGTSLRHISDGEFRRHLPRSLCIQATDQEIRPRPPPHHPVGSIPPPPAKHMERERFFKEKHLDFPALVGNMKGLSVQSRAGSSSRSGSADFSDTSGFHD